MDASTRLSQLWDSARQDVRYAIRGLRRSPAFAATVAATLALGIGANAAMFGILDRILLRAPEHIVAPDRLVQVHTGRLGQTAVQSSQSYRFHKDLIEGVPSFRSVAVATSANPYPLGRGATATRIAGVQVTPSFFPTLGVRPELGRFFHDDEAGEANPGKVAVISHDFWRRGFDGRRDVVGMALDIGIDRYTIVGVAPRGFTGAELADVDVWIPIAAADGLRFEKGPEWLTTRASTWLRVYARLADGASAERALAEATAAYRNAIRQRNAETSSNTNTDSLRVLFGSIIPGRSPATGSGLNANSIVVRVARLLGLVSGLVLLLACANVANLLLVRALGRKRELAVRLALGISRRRLACQLALEGLLLAAIGALGALFLVQLTSGALRRLLLPAALGTASAIDGRVLLVTMAATVVTALLVSILPVVQFTNPELAGALKSGAREGGGSRSRTRATLLALQSALALMLLAGAGLFVRSLQRVAELPLGIDMDRVVIASIEHATAGLSNDEAQRLHLDFMERARAVPGVTAAAVSIAHSFGLGWGTRVSYRGERLQLPNQGFAQYGITPDYFTVMGVRIVAGRGFTDTDREGTQLVAVINETAARSFWPAGDAIGQCITVGADSMPCTTIVGIATNSRRQQLVEGPIPQIYRPLLQIPRSVADPTVSNFGYTLLARSDRPAAVVEPLRRAIQSTAPNVPYAHVRTLADQFGDRHTRAWTLGASMFSLFGVLALVIAAIGLFSVVTFTMAQRTHEYGVRLALGATRAHLVWITMLRGLFPATLGLVVGAAVALAAGKVIASVLFETPANDPLVLGSVSGILLATAATACLVPGLRAARTDAATALRYD